MIWQETIDTWLFILVMIILLLGISCDVKYMFKYKL